MTVPQRWGECRGGEATKSTRRENQVTKLKDSQKAHRMATYPSMPRLFDLSPGEALLVLPQAAGLHLVVVVAAFALILGE